MSVSRIFTVATDILLGFLLAFIFALSMKAVLTSDYLVTGNVVRPQEVNTITICVFAAFLSALIAWWLQLLTKGNGLLARVLYGFVMLAIVYCAVGGLLVVLSNLFVYGEGNTAGDGVLLDGFFWESISGFYAFAIFMISALNIALLGLFVAAAFYMGLLGPKARQTAPNLVLRTGA